MPPLLEKTVFLSPQKGFRLLEKLMSPSFLFPISFQFLAAPFLLLVDSLSPDERKQTLLGCAEGGARKFSPWRIRLPFRLIAVSGSPMLASPAKKNLSKKRLRLSEPF